MINLIGRVMLCLLIFASLPVLIAGFWMMNGGPGITEVVSNCFEVAAKLMKEVRGGMIKISKSNTADTRTCDWSKVSPEELLASSERHIEDVKKGMKVLAEMILLAAERHDHTKISRLKEFHDDFKTGFKRTGWWEMHQKEERHHFNTPSFIRDDVNLIDVLEQIVDGVMAGMARSGKYRCEPLTNELLQKAYSNTAKLLLDLVQVEGREG